MYRSTAPRWVSASGTLEQTTSAFLYSLSILLALAMPFELVGPLLTTGPIRWTNLELLLALTMVVWAAELLVGASVRQKRRSVRHLPWSLLIPAICFLGFATISAIVAPSNTSGALKVVARFAMGLYTFALVAYVTKQRAGRVEGLLWAIVAGTGLSALLGWIEASGWPMWRPLLTLFKEAPSRVGGELRVSGTFQYATVAAMFFEATTPLALVLAGTARTVALRRVALLIAVLGCTLVVLTLTRSGLVTLASLLVGMLAGAAWMKPASTPRHLLRPVAVALLALVLTTMVMAWQSNTFLTRLTTENDLNWYNARYEAPATIELEGGVTQRVTVVAQNMGEVMWQAEGENAFALGYRWLSEDGQTALGPDHLEVPLPQDVRPGERVSVQVPIAPDLPAGEYRLEWSMLQREILWFTDRDVPPALTTVSITQGAETVAPPEPTVQTRPATEREEIRAPIPPTVGRRALWGAALEMWRERPLLGVGPGNYRHLYGHYLGMAEWDDRIYANNLYLELLATLGVLGLATFSWLLLAVGQRAVYTLRHSRNERARVWVLGLSAALYAFLLHGLLDYFLEVVSVYLLFWMTLGLIVSASRLAPERAQLSA